MYHHIRTLTVPSACESENAGAVTLGYTKLSWDDESGQERQPWASFKSWAQLTANEKAGALLLNYTQSSWDDVSGSETQPASTDKSWDELAVCDEGTDGSRCCRSSATHIYIARALVYSLRFAICLMVVLRLIVGRGDCDFLNAITFLV